ncbi:MAG: response regulator transcription factor [Planctomycetota bacterium]|jgi:DNA-binding CsgD family transcriptional regulator
MDQLPTDKDVSTNDTLFKKPKGMLLDEQQWLFLKKRYHMTPRELQVAILVCRGFNNDEIAKALRIRQGTVKTHLRNIYRRARVKSKILLLLKFVADVNKLYPPSKPPPIPITEIRPKIEPRFQDIQEKK